MISNIFSMFGIEYLSKFDNCLSKTIQNFPKLFKTTADHTFYFISENLVRFYKNQMLSVQPFKTDRYISLNVNKQIISDSNLQFYNKFITFKIHALIFYISSHLFGN